MAVKFSRRAKCLTLSRTSFKVAFKYGKPDCLINTEMSRISYTRSSKSTSFTSAQSFNDDLEMWVSFNDDLEMWVEKLSLGERPSEFNNRLFLHKLFSPKELELQTQFCKGDKKLLNKAVEAAERRFQIKIDPASEMISNLLNKPYE